MEKFARFADLHTRSFPTIAVLMMLGHQPIEALDDGVGGTPLVRFPKSAEPDLLRYEAAKKRAAKYTFEARRRK